jgi:Raf kinase inhibitor-like YbhB/YbcL family protein
MAGIELRSAAFNDHAYLSDRFAKAGENVSPPLSWSGVPDGATELVLLCEDPDAPTGTFLHWLVTGIDPSSTGCESGQVPSGGTAHTNGFGETGWGGPQPPVGDSAHRYFFRVYALPGPLPLSSADGADADEVRQVAEQQQLASGTLVGRYQR